MILCRGGYQDSLLQERSPSQEQGGRSQDFGGFGEDENKVLQNWNTKGKTGRKDSDDWGNGWGEDSTWSEPSPKKEVGR